MTSAHGSRGATAAATSRPTALVTGASSGIGEEFARQLARRDHDVVLVARDAVRLDALAEELRRTGAEVEVLAADLCDADSRAAVEHRLADASAPVELLVNNAGFGTWGRFDTLPLDRELREVELNVGAVLRCSHAAAAAMTARGHGGIINVSSLGARQPAPMMATYTATKAFVSSFTEALALELASTGVRVMVLEPGFTRTGFQAAAGFSEERTKVPEFLWSGPAEVVETALADYERGKVMSVPGWSNKVMAAGASALPGGVSRKVASVLVGSSPGSMR